MNDLKSTILKIAKETLEKEMEAISFGMHNIDASFVEAVNAISNQVLPGRVIVIGMGKSGHIGNKISATLASTGTPAFFVHPGEAGHGDLGMLTEMDIVIGISQSGQSNELIQLIPYIKRKKIQLIAMTGNINSDLATHADYIINTSVPSEACPLGLAPTSSTTLTLALGDALALSLLQLKGFTSENFAETHPSGLLGRRLLLTVNDIMRDAKSTPTALCSDSIKDVLPIMASGQMGFVVVIDDKRVPIGVFTDGDLRRCLSEDYNISLTKLAGVMTKDFSVISNRNLAVDALNIMESKKISALPVVDEQEKIFGAISMQNLLDHGVI